ncbi:uncharacterized protein [Clytia hemisphaerica]|uniref:C2H2-type domain-containing protein n=1 Tax=Clytia hemisphaerica TaxID=252671 RepID=A0A7M5WT39_9CNID|eukprot:TCONS_00033347-protein
MSDDEKHDNTLVSLFEEDVVVDDSGGGGSSIDVENVEEQIIIEQSSFFHDKLDKTDIYKQDDEEVYIATSPSFSLHDAKEGCNINDIYNSEDTTSQLSGEKDDNLKCDAAFSDISSDSHSVEYGDTTTNYSTINNDGQNYFINTDYTHVNNLGAELSTKGYFYVLSPSTFGNAVIKPESDDHLTSTMMVNPVSANKVSPNINNKIRDSTTVSVQEGQATSDIGLRPSMVPSTMSSTVPSSDFEPLNTDYVSFIPGIPDSPAKEHQNQVTWHRVIPNQDSLTKQTTEIQNSLLMKYDNDSVNKMEVPIINGQPYLQVALVNELDSTSTGELVCADQILGVTATSKMFKSCRWEGCNAHVLTNEELIHHVNNSHVTVDRNQNYSCFWKGCVREGRPFNARYKMVIHLRTHTGEKPHTCRVKGCEASFGRIENMKIHMRSHTGEKPYRCPYEGCNKEFANSSDRFKHSRTHKEKKPFRCTVEGCEKSYTDPSSLRKHKKRHLLQGNNLTAPKKMNKAPPPGIG